MQKYFITSDDLVIAIFAVIFLLVGVVWIWRTFKINNVLKNND